MSAAQPPVDPRGYGELVRDTRRAVRKALGPPVSQDDSDPVPGEGLIRIFARLAEIVSERVNRVPEKNLLAFLSMIGLDQQPPQPARVPLTFSLAKGATSARVPAGTTVAAKPAEGEDAPPSYETERELVVTAAQPIAAFVREPQRDRYGDAASALKTGGEAVAVFEGDRPIDHELYVGDRMFALAQRKDVELRFGPPVPYATRWFAALSWSAFDGVAWQPAAVTVIENGEAAVGVMFPGLAGVASATVSGAGAPWLRARLRTTLPRGGALRERESPPGTVRQAGLVADAAASGGEVLDPSGALEPFGGEPPASAFFLACEPAFTKPGAKVSITVELDASVTATPTADLALRWECLADGFVPLLGRSSATTIERPQGTFGFVDHTLALHKRGAIQFTVPADWPATVVAGHEAHWLRVSIDRGGYGSPPARIGPVIERVRIDYAWDLPPVEALERRVTFEAAKRPPDAVVVDGAPLDTSKDFLPFGEQPALNDAFYVVCDEAFSLPEARVSLHFTPVRAALKATAPDIQWEIYDPATDRWRATTVEDETNNLTWARARLDATKVSLTMPANLGPVELAGRLCHCVRARLVGGDYGRPASFEAPAQGSTVVKTQAATWDPPTIVALDVSYEHDTGFQPPEAVVTMNDFESATPAAAPSSTLIGAPPPWSRFHPFTPTREDRPALYVGMDSDFSNSATLLFLDVVPASYDAGTGRSAPPPEPPVVAWEYRGADGWQALGTRDETRGFARRGLLSFIAPVDFARASEFGVEAYWLRARWERGQYPAAPRLARLLTNSVWASNVTTIRDELLGSGTGEEHQAFRVAGVPILPGQQLEVRELGTPSAVELAAISTEQGTGAVTPVPAEPGSPEQTWVRWHPVVDFYASGPRSRHYVVDRLTGQIRFGDGLRGMAPPPGRGNVRARVYRTGGGVLGNRSEGTITELKSAVPYVGGVTNHVPAAGGADAEPVDAVRERGPRALRHGDRAVTIGDVEDLARAASSSIARVLGVPATGSRDAGGVGVVVVPGGDERQPVPTLELLERVRSHLEARLPLNATLWVAGPGWVRVDVTAEVVAVSADESTDVQSAVRAALDRFLHPLSGGHQGGSWGFGRTPRRSDVLAIIESVTGVDHVRGLGVAKTQTTPEPAPESTLLYSGTHDIAMASSTDEAAP